MKISCDIIRDILPLYAEDMVSDATKELVDDHLCQCDACTKELGVLKKADKVPAQVEVNSLKRVGDSIRRRRILAVMAVLLFVGTVLLGGALLLDARIYLSAEQAVESVEALEDGSIRMRMSNLVVGIGGLGSGNMKSDEPTGNYGIICYTNLRKILFPQPVTPYEDLPEEIRALVTKEDWGASTWQLEGGASSQNFWYCSPWDGTGETLLWDAGNPYSKIPLGDVNYHLAYYCVILVVLAAAFALVGNKFKNKWYGELSIRFSILFGSMCLSVIMVSAGQLMEIWGEFTECFINSFILAVPMTLTTLFARQLLKLNRQDKGL